MAEESNTSSFTQTASGRFVYKLLSLSRAVRSNNTDKNVQRRHAFQLFASDLLSWKRDALSRPPLTNDGTDCCHMVFWITAKMNNYLKKDKVIWKTTLKLCSNSK